MERTHQNTDGLAMFQTQLLSITVSAPGQRADLTGSLSERRHSGTFRVAVAALLRSIAEARPDLEFSELKTERDTVGAKWGFVWLLLGGFAAVNGALELMDRSDGLTSALGYSFVGYVFFGGFSILVGISMIRRARRDPIAALSLPDVAQSLLTNSTTHQDLFATLVASRK